MNAVISNFIIVTKQKILAIQLLSSSMVIHNIIMTS